ncbi:MAG: LysM peptidoglycan-binding domain-containing protein, partial [Aeromicrobium sp.]|nr:LysM peptidoglycan-binding domain-containing protein [Burkholderiales bacterium]
MSTMSSTSSTSSASTAHNVHIAKRVGSVLALTVAGLLTACSTKTPAPVSDRRAPPAQQPAAPTASAAASQPQSDAKLIDLGKTHTVQKGDTLIGLALQYGLDYRELAAWNNIENPNVIKFDSVLRLTPPGTVASGASTAQRDPKDPIPGAPVTTPLVPTPLPSASNERPATNSATSKAEPRGGKVPFSDAAYQRLSSQAAAAPSLPPLLPLLPLPPLAPGATAPTAAAAATPASPAATAVPVPVPASPVTTAANDDVEWVWPVKGKITSTFTDANKGIDIAGIKGTSVNAAGAGKVIYSGS